MKKELHHLYKMITYLGKDQYVIPAYGMRLPEIVDKEYRPERLFFFHKNGTMSYYGSGYKPVGLKPDIVFTNIRMEDDWIERTFDAMAGDIKKILFSRFNTVAGTKYIEAALHFNGMEFIDIRWNDVYKYTK